MHVIKKLSGFQIFCHKNKHLLILFVTKSWNPLLAQSGFSMSDFIRGKVFHFVMLQLPVKKMIESGWLLQSESVSMQRWNTVPLSTNMAVFPVIPQMGSINFLTALRKWESDFTLNIAVFVLTEFEKRIIGIESTSRVFWTFPISWLALSKPCPKCVLLAKTLRQRHWQSISWCGVVRKCVTANPRALCPLLWFSYLRGKIC